MRTTPIRSPLDGTATPPSAREAAPLRSSDFADILRQQSARAAAGAALRGGLPGGAGAPGPGATAVPTAPGRDAAPARPEAPRERSNAAAPAPAPRQQPQRDDSVARTTTATPAGSADTVPDAGTGAPRTGEASAATAGGPPADAAPVDPTAADTPPQGTPAEGTSLEGTPMEGAPPAGTSPRGPGGAFGRGGGATAAAPDAGLATDAHADAVAGTNAEAAADPHAVTAERAKRPTDDPAANDAAANPWLAALVAAPAPSVPADTPATAETAVQDGTVPSSNDKVAAGSTAQPAGTATAATSRTGLRPDVERIERGRQADRRPADDVVALPADGALPDFHPIAPRSVDAARLPHAAATAPAADAAALIAMPGGAAPAAGPAVPASGTASVEGVASAAALSALRAPPAGPADTRPVLPTVTLPAPFGTPQFADALGAQVSLYAAGGVQQAELRLNPAETGPIQVQIAIDGTQARVDFHAAAAATRQAIEAGLPQLAAALRDQGLTLAGGGVFDGSSRRGAEPGNGRGDGASDGAERGDRGERGTSARAGAAPLTVAQRLRQGSAAGLDVYA